MPENNTNNEKVGEVINTVGEIIEKKGGPQGPIIKKYPTMHSAERMKTADKYNIYQKQEFAKNFALSKDKDPKKVFIKTFPDIKNPRANGLKLLEEEYVKAELQALLPSNQDIAKMVGQAIHAPNKEEDISWRDKHQYIETVLKVGGYLKNNEGDKNQINVGIVIEE